MAYAGKEASKPFDMLHSADILDKVGASGKSALCEAHRPNILFFLPIISDHCLQYAKDYIVGTVAGAVTKRIPGEFTQ